ncbi:hypothetical protein DdX_17645 [Ditylenchus destructor]|uniref:Uncharacterized protein n=1 Tax=Ditylenchus destructor TaxID=166010 RepID=A0AAD4MN35_9BILA|nr:hypothetical protein DdX_17645 [Ditylenchus destructor]
MDFRIWQPPEGISAEEKKDLWLEYLDRTPRPINSPLDLDQIVQEIKLTHSRGTRHEIDYNFSVRGVKPCWDDGLMDRVIYLT